MSDSDNFGSDLESDCFGSHLGASDEEVDECNVNAVRMHPTLDLDSEGSEWKDWGRLKTLEDECVLQVPNDEDLYDDEALARSALARRRVQALVKSAQELENPFDKLVVDDDEVLTIDKHKVFKVFNRVFIALCSQVHDTVKNYPDHNGDFDPEAMGDYFEYVQTNMDNLVTVCANGNLDVFAMQRKDFFDLYMPHFHNIDIDSHAGSTVDNEVNKKLAEDTGYAVDVEWDLNPGSTYWDYGVPEFMELVTVKADARARGDVALAVRAYIDDIDDFDDIDISTSTNASTSTVVADGNGFEYFVFDGRKYEHCSVYQFVECYFHDETEDGTWHYIDVECLRRVQEMIPGTYHYRDESVPESFVPAGVYFGYLPKSQEQEIDDISGGESNPLPFKYFPWDAEMHRSINAELQWLQDCIIEHGEYDVKTDLFDLLIDHCDDDSGKRTKWTKLAKKLRKKLKRKHPNIREVTKKVTQKLDDWIAAQQSDSSTSSDSSSDSE